MSRVADPDDSPPSQHAGACDWLEAGGAVLVRVLSTGRCTENSVGRYVMYVPRTHY